MKLGVGSNSQRGPRHGEAAGFRVPKDFSGEKERNGSNFIKAGGRARAAKKKEGECTKKDIRTDAAGSSQRTWLHP